MRWPGASGPRRPPPEPVATDERVTMAVGTLAWLVLAVVALAARGPLGTHGHGWWFSACAAGVALGLVGLWHELRRARRPRR